MNKLRFSVAALLCAALLLGNIPAAKAETGEVLWDIAPYGIDYVYSSDNYAGFSLSWENNGWRDLLMEASNPYVAASYEYDGETRISKSVNDVITYFDYLDGRLVSETRDGVYIQYIYDADGFIAGFAYDDETYDFELDWDRSVVGIFLDDERVIEYVYESGLVAQVLAYEDDAVTDKTDDPSCIGNINMIRFFGYYFDAETGWYYAGRYYDSVGQRFVDGVEPSPFSVHTVPNGIMSAIESEYNGLMTSSTIGAPISYSSSWYTSLSDVEILARLIYGENTEYYDGQKAISWVIVNRYYGASWFGNTLRAIATNGGQFATITGDYNSTGDARNPNRGTSSSDSEGLGWRQAVMLAVKLWATLNVTYLSELMPKPSGINGQTYFRRLDTFLNLAVSQQGPTYIQWYSNGSWGNITEVTVLGNGGVSNTNDRSVLFTIPNPGGRDVFWRDL
ncbi:MAG: cell wall hydrolase [Clostridiales bacterium]|jgi:hypothetical protein|nr:cell wall hydrolase [Clostridiales bacterium]